MLRKALTILSLAGLLGCIGLWALSYFNIYYVDRYVGVAGPGRSKLVIACGALTWPDLGPAPLPQHDTYTAWVVVGFHGFETFLIPGYRSGFTLLRIPLWMPTALFAWLVWLRQARRHRLRRRRELGLCAACGYDLRGSSGCCPECGKAK